MMKIIFNHKDFYNNLGEFHLSNPIRKHFTECFLNVLLSKETNGNIKLVSSKLLGSEFCELVYDCVHDDNFNIMNFMGFKNDDNKKLYDKEVLNDLDFAWKSGLFGETYYDDMDMALENWSTNPDLDVEDNYFNMMCTCIQTYNNAFLKSMYISPLD